MAAPIIAACSRRHRHLRRVVLLFGCSHHRCVASPGILSPEAALEALSLQSSQSGTDWGSSRSVLVDWPFQAERPATVAISPNNRRPTLLRSRATRNNLASTFISLDEAGALRRVRRCQRLQSFPRLSQHRARAGAAARVEASNTLVTAPKRAVARRPREPNKAGTQQGREPDRWTRTSTSTGSWALTLPAGFGTLGRCAPVTDVPESVPLNSLIPR